jgi:Ca2+-binding RTX toxin-like protein
MGDAYYSMAPGIVVKVDRAGTGDWGNFVTILHDGGVYATYAHFGRVKVNERETVVGGSYLGDVGDTGEIDAVHAHVHLGTRIKGGVADGSADGVPPAFFPAMFDFNEIPSPINRDVRSTDVYGTSGDDGEAGRPDNFGGTAADNRIFGGAGNDILKGHGGNDELWGGTGSDVLIGGSGRDHMTGGPGRDRFDFDSVGEIQRDLILDFSGSRRSGDKIDLSTIDARSGTAKNDAFTFVGSNAFAKAGDLRAVNVGGGKYEVSGDVTGDGRADFTIIVYSTDPLTSSDFVL